MDPDVIVFNENDILEVRGLIQGAILNGNKVRLISFDEDTWRWEALVLDDNDEPEGTILIRSHNLQKLQVFVDISSWFISKLFILLLIIAVWSVRGRPDLPPVQLQRKTRPWIGRVHGSNPRHVL